LPVAAETYDGFMNDMNGFHVKAENVMEAIDDATPGVTPAEGNVGGGTGMSCFSLKGSTGTASRVLSAQEGGYTIGVLVQCNTGSLHQLSIGGVPVGRDLPDSLEACVASRDPSIHLPRAHRCPGFAVPGETSRRFPAGGDRAAGIMEEGQGSMIVVVATDAPLLPHQLERLLKRLPAGMGREGTVAGNFDGDIFIAFSTANPHAAQDSMPVVHMVSNERIGPIFQAASKAIEAAITNGLLAGEPMTGADYLHLSALPVNQLPAIFAKYGQPLH
jgi:L-aminopeptidase/D-esterase-like protein